MDLLDYDRQTEAFFNHLKLPTDAQIVKKEIVPQGISAWDFQLYLTFGDQMYVECQERWSNYPGLVGLARRTYFCHHYGPYREVDSHGIPRSIRDTAIRIDCTKHHGVKGTHVHLATNVFSNEQVNGLDLDTVDVHQFVTGILEVRNTTKTLEEVFGFTV